MGIFELALIVGAAWTSFVGLVITLAVAARLGDEQSVADARAVRAKRPAQSPAPLAQRRALIS